MNPPINYYYYYYAGEPDRKAYDIERVCSFIKDSSNFLYDFFEKIPKQEIEEYLQVGDYSNYQFITKIEEWIDEVKRRSTQEIRNFTISTFTLRDKEDVWNKLEIVGLTDVQLDVKLNIWDSVFRQLKTLFEESIIDFRNKTIPKFFELTKTLYESLSTAFPYMEYLNEFLKYLETLFVNNQNQ